MDLESSLQELRRHIFRRGLVQRVHAEFEGSFIRIHMLEEDRMMYIGYRAGSGNFLVSAPDQPPKYFFRLDSASIVNLLPSSTFDSPHARAAKRLEDHVLFVSYATRDEAIVKPLVDLLRVTKAEVFRDKDSIRPGQLWRNVIQDSVKGCSEFILFWCAHSAVSNEVRQEYELALQLDKLVVPVLLDGTALNDELSKRQFIDMRQFHRHHGETEPQVGNQGLILHVDASLYLMEELGRVLRSIEQLEPGLPMGSQKLAGSRG